MKLVLAILVGFYVLQIFLPNSGILTDPRDGNKYAIVKLGEFWWMKENLNYKTVSGSVYNNDDSLTYSVYGKLYNWDTANSACPYGWHLSTNEDWKNLEQFLGISSDEYRISGHYYIGTDQGGKLKATKLWNDPNSGATNATGFSAIPAGIKHGKDAPEPWKHNFYDLGEVAQFWVSEISPDEAFVRILSKGESRIHIIDAHKSAYRSVRCVKDSTAEKK